MSKFPQKTADNILKAFNDKAQEIPRDRYNTTKLLDLFIARELAKLDKADGVIVKYVMSFLYLVFIFRRSYTRYPSSVNEAFELTAFYSVVDPGMCDSDLARELNLGPVVM